MTVIRDRIMVFFFLGGPLLCISTGAAHADSLRAELTKRVFLLYEPVAIEVVLRLDDALVVDFDANAGEAEKQLRRIPRRLHVKLRNDEGTEVSESLLFGAEFAGVEPDRQATDYSAGGLAFFELSNMAAGGAWELEPGHYTLVVSGGGRLRSNDMPLEIRAPRGKEQAAAGVFLASLPGAVGIIIAQEDQTGELSLFEDLARDYADTVYGKYARVSLMLLRYRETFAAHNNKGGAAVWASVARELATVEGVFAGRHPLRERVLFHLAITRALSGDYAGARQSALTLKEIYPYGRFASQSQQLKKEIDEMEKKDPSAKTNDQ